MAAPQGVEPRYAAPEAAVLPLNEGATRALRPGVAVGLGPRLAPGAISQPVHHKWIRAGGQTPGTPHTVGIRDVSRVFPDVLHPGVTGADSPTCCALMSRQLTASNQLQGACFDPS